MASIFSQIIKGDLPSYKIYEDEHTFAFLDINPINPGHTLLVPKTEVDHLWDLPDSEYQALMAAAKKLSLHIRATIKCPRVGLVVEGFAVPHAHLHLIPVYEGFESTIKKPKTSENSEADLAAMAKKLYLNA